MTLVSVTLCFGIFSNQGAGTATAQFLKLGAGARAVGIGEAYSGVVDDSTALYWNPAGLNEITGNSVVLMHALWFEDIAYDWISYGKSLGRKGVIGVGVQYLSYGSITQTDATGLETGSFLPTDMAASLGYARSIGGVDVGITAKYISSKITHTATAFAVDAGVQDCVCNDKLTLAAVVQNVGAGMKFVTEEDPLPMNVKLGAGYLVKQNWLVALELNAPSDNDLAIGAGMEYRYAISEKISTAIRAGYNTISKDTGGLNGISAGLGFTYMKYTIDYAFAPYGDLGTTHWISLGVMFR